MSDFFPGFEQRQIETSGATINLVTGGNGPPLLLLHGYPQTHVMWRKVAPRLAQDFTVVVPDLRGYGDSSKPPAGENFINYSKRVLALDQVEVMAALGDGRETSHIATLQASATSWRTNSRPIPLPPPVTTAVLPANSVMCTSLAFWRRPK